MNNKRAGGILILISLLLLGVIVSYNIKLNNRSDTYGCNPNASCMQVNSLLTLTNIFIGIIFSILSLGFYFIVFSKAEEELLKKIKNLEKEKRQLSKDEKFSLFLRALSNEEQEILKIVKEQEGITQSTLRFKTGLSKTKLSFVLSDLEKKNIIQKENFGKTNKIFMKIC